MKFLARAVHRTCSDIGFRGLNSVGVQTSSSCESGAQMAGGSRILIVDDSALSREALRRALELAGQLTVVGEAKTGEEALVLAAQLRPDLITMDLNMPGMGGLKAIEAIMRERPTPVVVISERSSTSGVDLNYEAISRGALELVPKSAVFGAGPNDAKRFAEHLRRLAEAGRDRERASPVPVHQAPPTKPETAEPPVLLGIGASTGGPRAVAKLLSDLPKDFSLPIALVQHMAEDFFDSFVRFLGDASGRVVLQATQGLQLRPGQVVVAPPRGELFVTESLEAKLLPSPRDALISPSVDSLFFSMAKTLQSRGIGLLMTGMGDDGAQGLLRMRRVGAHTLVQNRETCAVFGMPRAAIELGAADISLPLDGLAPWLSALMRGGPRPRAIEPKKKRVLVVDEDLEVLKATKKTLEAGGLEVHTLDNPLLVAQTIRRLDIDLVLLETELSTMKGAVVIQSLRNHGLGRVPVMLHSKLDSVALHARAKEVGAQGFIRKGSGSLVREVDGFLGSRGNQS